MREAQVKCGECPNQAFVVPSGHELRAHLEGRQVIGVCSSRSTAARGGSSVPYERRAHAHPTLKILDSQRDALYEQVRNHLAALGDLWIALEHKRDYATAERLGIEFGEDFAADGRPRLGPR